MYRALLILMCLYAPNNKRENIETQKVYEIQMYN